MVILNSFCYPESVIRYEERSVLSILDKKNLGLGTLFVSESTLCWQGSGDSGFSVGYQDISLHAISKDETVYPRECLYVMLDARLSMPGDEPQTLNDEGSDTDTDSDITELIFVPSEENTTSIASMYEAIKICQELNPDFEDMDDDDDDNLYADAEDEFEEGRYSIRDRGAGDIDIDTLSRRLEENSVDANFIQNGNEDDEFQDAD